MTDTQPESEIGPVAWACLHCNSPRAVDPCQKCGTPLQKPADGWHWPSLPDVDRIRALAKEVGYAVGVHGSLERDLDLMACPWTEGAVPPMALAEHIAAGMNGRVLDYERQDKPLGRWACNIAVDGWFKLIDLSVAPRIDADAAIIAGLRHDVESAGSLRLRLNAYRDRAEAAEAREKELERRLRDETAIVDRIWGMLGRPSYEALAGRSIYDLIAELQARAVLAIKKETVDE